MRPATWSYAGRIPLETFLLGAHEAHWLQRTAVPLFVSRRRLEKRKRLPRARGVWALDSGGFTELALHGRWTITVDQYVAEVRRYVTCIGGLQWAAPMDWMAEPSILRRTGLSVEEHQRRTVRNYLELRMRAPEIPWIPMLQGWSISDYWRHAEAYEGEGVALASLPLVGVGSVCRRQGTATVAVLLAGLAEARLRLHCFGMKVTGLRRAACSVVSADSLAWIFAARKRPLLPECRGTHRRCNNCLRYALAWRSRVLRTIDLDDRQAPGPPLQSRLFPDIRPANALSEAPLIP